MTIVPGGLRLRARYVVELPLRSRNLLPENKRENWISWVGFSERVMWSKKEAAPKTSKAPE